MNKRNHGYVLLHRTIRENNFYRKKPFSEGQAFVDLILLANHAPGEVKVRGNSIHIPRGGVGRSAETLAQSWGWSRKEVLCFLKRLAADGMITIEKHGRILNVIVIVNYSKYQGKPSDPKTQ